MRMSGLSASLAIAITIGLGVAGKKSGSGLVLKFVDITEGLSCLQRLSPSCGSSLLPEGYFLRRQSSNPMPAPIATNVPGSGTGAKL